MKKKKQICQNYWKPVSQAEKQVQWQQCCPCCPMLNNTCLALSYFWRSKSRNLRPSDLNLSAKTTISQILNLVKLSVVVILILMILSCHNFAHATTAQLSWDMQKCDLIRSLIFMLEQYTRFGLQAHERLARAAGAPKHPCLAVIQLGISDPLYNWPRQGRGWKSSSFTPVL